MTFELMDYQIIAIFLLGATIAGLIGIFIDEYQQYKGKSKKAYLKHMYRMFEGMDIEPRIVKSNPKSITDFDK